MSTRIEDALRCTNPCPLRISLTNKTKLERPVHVAGVAEFFIETE
jgi:hypothetical protein